MTVAAHPSTGYRFTSWVVDAHFSQTP
ncbi:hypothetical protein ACFZDJ_43485 [Streptomyces sp. NPDC007896]